MSRAPRLLGKLLITGQLKAVTGLRIGAATSSLDIGGVDQPVLREPVTGRPYLPGSSMKGKMRSLLTRAYGYAVRELVKRPVVVRLHWCEEREEYGSCLVCPTFGQFPSGPDQRRFDFVTPTRLIVRDAVLLDRLETVDENGEVRETSWPEVETDLPYTEVKTEVALDLITAASNPRQMERVPAGALFGVEFLFSVFAADESLLIDPEREKERFRALFWAMKLLEDDYLGSSGTRGYGKVEFRDLRVVWRPLGYYRDPARHPEQVLWCGDRIEGCLADAECEAKLAAVFRGEAHGGAAGGA